jgi:hypothetical protein
MDKIDPELLKRLDALTAKLGVGAGEAWRILIKGAYVEATSWIPFLLLWVFVMGFGLYLLRLCRGIVDSEPKFWGYVGAGAMLCIGLSGIAGCVSPILTLLLNPEGHALNTVLWSLR